MSYRSWCEQVFTSFFPRGFPDLALVSFILCVSVAPQFIHVLSLSLSPSAGWSLKPSNSSACVSVSCLTTESRRTNPPPPQSEWAAPLALATRTICQPFPALNHCPPSLRRRETNPATRSPPYSHKRKVRATLREVTQGDPRFYRKSFYTWPLLWL